MVILKWDNGLEPHPTDFQQVNYKGTDQTVLMCWLVCAFVFRLQQSQVFSHRGPYDKYTYSLGRNYHRKHLDILLTPEKKHSKYIVGHE